MKANTFLLLLLFINSFDLLGQGIPYGQEFQVNTYTKGSQYFPTTAALPTGGFVVCWTSQKQDGSDFGVFGQIFDLSGNRIGNEFQVNTYTQGTQCYQTVAALPTGGFVVCWTSHNQDGSSDGVFGQLFDSSGIKKGDEFQINTYTQGSQGSPTVAAFSTGEFLVCWNSRNGVFGQLYYSSGIKKGYEFQINTDTQSFGDYPTVATFSNGGFIVCWSGYKREISYNYDIYGQLFHASGLKKGDEFMINTTSHGCETSPKVTVLSDEGFVVCWESYPYNESSWGIIAQMYDASGTKKGNEFKLNKDTYSIDFSPTIAALSDGKFLVCWASGEKESPFSGIFGQIFDLSGNRIGSEFQVNTYAQSSKDFPTAATLSTGGFVVCWDSYNNQDGSYRGIFGKRFPREPLVHQLQDFSLLTPMNDTILNTTEPTLCWQQPSNVIECYPWEIIFDLYIDTDFNFPNPQIISDIQDTTYTIDSLATGKTYFWKVLAKNLAGDSLWCVQQDWGFFIKRGATSVENPFSNLPQNFKLFQNHPNPFNSSTEIKYSLPPDKSSYHVELKIYDIRGRLVKTLVNESQAVGMYAVNWDGRDMNGQAVSSGMYFYTLQIDKFKATNKMLLIH